MFHAALSPNLLLTHFSNLVSSSAYSSGAYFSSMSADSIRVVIPLYSDLAKATTPLTRGIFIAFGSFGFSLVLRYSSPDGSRIAIAMRSGPCIITPSITACPPIEVGHASFMKILLKSVFAISCLSVQAYPVTVRHQRLPPLLHFLEHEVHKVCVALRARQIVYYLFCHIHDIAGRHGSAQHEHDRILILRQ